VRAHDGQSARISLRDGRVVEAILDGRRPAEGAACVYQTLTWSRGDFEFVSCPVDATDRLQTSTTHLLIEGARLLDEEHRVA
jgi:hypothetical protein